MAASLLSALYADVIEPEQLAKGFNRLVENVGDLQLDCPDATDTLSLFLARAVFDDILPPSYLKKIRRHLPQGALGLEVVQKTENHLMSPHHAERVERCWGGSTVNTVDAAKTKIVNLLDEYIAGGDMKEALRRIRELNLPFFHHEVVKRVLTSAMERNAPPLLALLREAADEGLVTSSQMSKGFLRVADCVDDLALDIPCAHEILHGFVSQATSEGWLSRSLAQSVSAELSASELNTIEHESRLLRDLKHKARAIIAEYFESGDLDEVRRSLEELAYPDLLHLFVKKLVTLAMDRKDREREMASVLLSELYRETLPSDQIEVGFSRLLESVEDLALDIPDAPSQLALFLARAVADDILAPLFLSGSESLMKEGSLGREVVHVAQATLSARHGGERVLRCWGGGTHTFEEAKQKVLRLLEEYEAGGGVSEACHCIRDLDMPFFHHEIVKKALIMAMEKKNERILELLQECNNEGLITTNQMVKGFNRVVETLSDLSLDIPAVYEFFKHYVEVAKKNGWLKSSFSYSVPDSDSSTPNGNGVIPNGNLNNKLTV